MDNTWEGEGGSVIIQGRGREGVDNTGEGGEWIIQGREGGEWIGGDNNTGEGGEWNGEEQGDWVTGTTRPPPFSAYSSCPPLCSRPSIDCQYYY